MTQISLTPDAVPIPTPRSHNRLLGWVASVDHKQIGIMYILATFVFFLVGGVEATLMRIQLARPENNFFSPEAYNQIFTMHGTTMIFLVVMPLLVGFGNYFVPLMIGAQDMAFPRLNALGLWLLVFGGLLLYYSFLAGGAPDAGWFAYTPLSEQPYSPDSGQVYWALALLVTGIGTVTSGINFIVTVITMRAPGLSLRRLPLFVWMNFINSFLIVAALPILNAALAMFLMDRLLDTHFFARGGSAILWQHYFWAFGHPEVYIMVLPAFGMISEVIPVFSRKSIFGYGFVAASTVAIAFLSFGVWAHHMFAAGLGFTVNAFFGASSMLIAIPTGVKIFNWVATMWGGAIRFSTSMLFAIGFLVMFTLGGLSGVMFADVPIDWQTTDTYFVVAHFHYVLFGGTLFAIFAGFYYWFPKMSGRMLNERLGNAPLAIGALLVLLPFFASRGERSPRRRPWSVAIVVLVVLMIGTLWLAGEQAPWSPVFSAQALPPSLTASQSAQAQHGATLFYSKGCLFCHAYSGQGGTRGPNLTTVSDQLTLEQITTTILNGRGNMPAYANSLTPADVRDLVAFLEARRLP